MLSVIKRTIERELAVMKKVLFIGKEMQEQVVG